MRCNSHVRMLTTPLDDREAGWQITNRSRHCSYSAAAPLKFKEAAGSRVDYAIIPLYLLVAVAAFRASRTAKACEMPPSDTRIWLMVAGVFALLIVVRGLNLEAQLSGSLRLLFHEEGWYAHRRNLQRPLVAVIILVTAVLVWSGLRQWMRIHSRTRVALFAATCAVIAYGPLYAFRISSLYSVDALLYSTGPIPLNWLIDCSLSTISLSAALYYNQRVRRRVREREGSLATQREEST